MGGGNDRAGEVDARHQRPAPYHRRLAGDRQPILVVDRRRLDRDGDVALHQVGIRQFGDCDRLLLLGVTRNEDGLEGFGHFLLLVSSRCNRRDCAATLQLPSITVGSQALRTRDLLAPPAEEFVDHDQHRAHRDEGVGKIEDGKGPDRRVEQDVVDDVAVDGAVDQIADARRR